MLRKDWINKKLKKSYEIHGIKREQEFYKNMLKGVEEGGTDRLFNQRTMAWLIVVVTLFLQLISLSTTFEGSKVYFEGVPLPFGLSAPLLFALAVQLIVFCMSHTIRKHFKPWLILILCMATLCSMYFSYVGIYNQIHSPIAYLEERYSEIYGKMTDDYQLVLDETNNQMKRYTFDLIGYVNKAYTSFKKQVEENTLLEEKIKNIKVDTGKLGTQTSSLKKPNINQYGENLDKYYEDMAKYNAAVGNMITDTTKQDAELRNQLYENEVKSLLGGKTKEQFAEEKVAVQTNKEQLEKLITSMYQFIGGTEIERTEEEKLMDVQNYIIDYILLGKGDIKVVSTVLTQLYTQVVDLGESKNFKDFEEHLNHFILLSKKDTVLMKSLEEVRKEIEGVLDGQRLEEKDAMSLYTTMQREIKNASFLLNQTKALEEPIDLKSDAYSMHHLYVLPIKQLTTGGEEFVMAWFCLGFAILVDGLTLLFALMEGKEKTALSAKKNKDIIGNSKEEVEEVLLSNLMAMEEEVVQRESIAIANKSLKRFLGQFIIISETIETGYSMWAPLEELGGYHLFIAVLCQFNFATILTGNEIEIVEKEQLNEGAKYVFLKTKFIIWANKKIITLTQQEEYLEKIGKLKIDLGKGKVV